MILLLLTLSAVAWAAPTEPVDPCGSVSKGACLDSTYPLPREEAIAQLRDYWMSRLLPEAVADHQAPTLDEAPQPELNEYESRYIRLYTGDLYASVNHALRTEPVGTIKGAIKMLRKALAKFPVFTGVAFRAEFVPSSEMMPMEAMPAHVASIQPGDIILRKEFLSSSARADLDVLGTLSFRPVYTIILSRTGRFIARFSKRRPERKVLFLPNTRFRVLKKETHGPKTFLLLEELPAQDAPAPTPIDWNEAQKAMKLPLDAQQIERLKAFTSHSPENQELVRGIVTHPFLIAGGFSFNTELVRNQIRFILESDPLEPSPILKEFPAWLNEPFLQQVERSNQLEEILQVIKEQKRSALDAVSEVRLAKRIMELSNKAEASTLEPSPRFQDNRLSLRITKGSSSAGLQSFGQGTLATYADLDSLNSKLIKNGQFSSSLQKQIPLEALLIDRFDAFEQNVIRNIFAASHQTREFREAGAWILTLKDGQRFASSVMTSDNDVQISGRANEDAFWELILARVTDYDQIQTIQFLHSHPPDSPLISEGDLVVWANIRHSNRLHYLRSGKPRVEIHGYAISEVGSRWVATHYGKLD